MKPYIAIYVAMPGEAHLHLPGVIFVIVAIIIVFVSSFFITFVHHDIVLLYDIFLPLLRLGRS